MLAVSEQHSQRFCPCIKGTLLDLKVKFSKWCSFFGVVGATDNWIVSSSLRVTAIGNTGFSVSSFIYSVYNGDMKADVCQSALVFPYFHIPCFLKNQSKSRWCHYSVAIKQLCQTFTSTHESKRLL